MDSGAIERAIATLDEQGYVDDARFARLFAQDKRELEGWGSERIEKGLVARGIERELIATALADEPAGDELDRALSLLSRRFPARSAIRATATERSASCCARVSGPSSRSRPLRPTRARRRGSCGTLPPARR